MRSPVQSVFKLVLEISSKLTADTIYKSPRAAKIFVKEGFAFVLKYRNIQFFLECMPALILSLASNDTISKKRSSKQLAIITNTPSCIKMVFALLSKPVIYKCDFLKYSSRK